MVNRGLHLLRAMDKRIWMFVPLSLFFLLSHLYRTSSAVIASDLMHDLSLTPANLGFLSSVFFYAFAFIQIPMGAAIDRFGARRLILTLSCLGLAGAVIFALAGSFPAAVLGRGLLGVGMACGFMGPLKLFTVWFSPGAFATLSGLFLSIGVMGFFMATAPLAVAVDWMGWRKAFLLIAFIHLLTTLWIYAVVKDRPGEGKGSGTSSARREGWWKESTGGIRQVLWFPSLWFIYLSTFVRYSTYLAIGGLWAGPYLESVYHIPLMERGRMLMAFPIGFIVGSPVYGFVSDRILKNRKWVAIMGMSLYTLVILPLTGILSSPTPILLVVIFFGIGFFSASGPVMFAHAKELLPSSLSGTAMAAVNFFTIGGVAFFQHIMGIMIDRVTLPQGELTNEAFSSAFSFCFVAAAAGIVSYLFVKEPRPSDSA